MQKTRIAIFASGSGSNALNLIDHFREHDSIEVVFVLSNRKEAPIVEKAVAKGMEVLCYSNAEVENGEFITTLCLEKGIDYIILAGYLRLIPGTLVTAFPERIINLHPSLLPKYGGKGMYGRKVHEAVLASGEKTTGITIHYVNEDFDKGRIIAQFHCKLDAGDGVGEIEKKIRELEQHYLPVVIEKTILLAIDKNI